MIRFLTLNLIFIISLFSNELLIDNDNNQTIINKPLEKVLYLNYEKIPKRVINGEIFSITIKSLSTIKKFQDITYTFNGGYGIKLLTEAPFRNETNKYYHDTFYFLATKKRIKTPNITATLLTEKKQKFKKTTIFGKKINVITLNPKKEFANVIAKSFILNDYKTTNFDQHNNIIVFSATAKNCNIKAFKLQNIDKQGIESVVDSIEDSKITYYAIIDKRIENLIFSYFNPEKNKFSIINIPIIVNDDSVATQTDLKPKDQSKDKLKMGVASLISIIGIILILWRRKKIYILFIIIPIIYIGYLAIPSKSICIKEGSKIYLLPVDNGTIFETTQNQYNLLQEGSIKNFTKVKLYNEKIGWVKNEDICTY